MCTQNTENYKHYKREDMDIILLTAARSKMKNYSAGGKQMFFVMYFDKLLFFRKKKMTYENGVSGYNDNIVWYEDIYLHRGIER